MALVLSAMTPLATATSGSVTAKINSPANGSTFTRVFTIQFQDGSTASSCTITDWSWNFGDGSTSSARNPTYKYSTLGTFTYTLTVTGDCGASSSTSRVLHIVNIKPKAQLAATPSPGIAGETVTLSGAASTDQDGTVTTYRFTLDGALQPDQASATYEKVWTTTGTKTVSLLVVDNDGGVSNTAASLSVNIQPAALDHITFEVAPASTDADTPVTFLAKPYDVYNNLRTDAITYSLDSGSGSIDPSTGVFTPDQVGTSVIRASSGSVFATTSVTVSVGALDHVAFVTEPTTTDADTPVTFLAKPYDANGNERTDAVTYSVTAGSGSIGASSGVFTPTLVGTTTLQAAAGSKTDSADLGVTVGALHHLTFSLAPAGTDADTPVTFEAKAYDQHNNLRADTITYSLGSGSSGAIDGATGVFTPNQAGTQTLVATAGAVTASASTVVTAGALHHVTFVTAPATTDADTPVTFVAQGRDQFDNPRTDVLAYSVASGSGAIDGSTGVFTPDQVGTTTLQASTADKTATVDLAVTVGALHHLTFSAAPVETDADTPVTFAASPYDQHNNLRTDTVSYSLASGTGSVGGATGVFTPDLVGVNTIRATAGGVSADASIAVGVGALDHVLFTAAPATTDADTDVTFEAKPYDANGNLRADAITYSLESGSGNIDGSTGVFTPDLVGTTVVKATAGLKSATASLTITVGALDHIDFTTAPASTDADTAVTFVAQGEDANGNVRPDVVTFSRFSGTGTVSSTGLFTPEKVGTTVVQASIGAVTAQASLSVTVGALDHVAFLVAPPDTDIATPVTFQAKGFDAHDNERTDAAAYSLGAFSPGSIDAVTGLYTPTEAGYAEIVATIGGETAQVTLVVSETPLDHVHFTLAPTATTADVAVTFRAEPHDQVENILTHPIHFTVVSGSGSIDEFTGEFTPHLAGTTTIRGTAGATSIFAERTLVVSAGPLHEVRFDVAPGSTDASQAATFLARGYDVVGNVRSDAITYSIASGSGSIDPATGVFTPNLVGTTTIQAAAGGKTATASLTVTVGPLAQVVFTSAPGSTDADTAVTFAAQARDANGNVLSLPVTYSVTSGSGAIGASSGVFTPNLAGTTLVRAEASEGGNTFGATSTLLVGAGALASLGFAATPPASTDADTPVSFAAIPRDAKGNVRTDTVTYTLVGGSGAVDAAGLFTPQLVGTSTVKAEAGAFSVQASLFVEPGAAAVTLVDLPQTLMNLGQTLAVTASATDQHGNAVTGIACDWEATLGDIVSTGADAASFTATGAGLATLSATCDGALGSSEVEVVDLLTLSITPQAPLYRPTDAALFGVDGTVEVRYADGSPAAGATVVLSAVRVGGLSSQAQQAKDGLRDGLVEAGLAALAPEWALSPLYPTVTVTAGADGTAAYLFNPDNHQWALLPGDYALRGVALLGGNDGPAAAAYAVGYEAVADLGVEEPAPPEVPEAPEVPEPPAAPAVPEPPAVPPLPAVPEAPEVPEPPAAPAVPEPPPTPEVPAPPALPATPEPPALPAAPELPPLPEVPA